MYLGNSKFTISLYARAMASHIGNSTLVSAFKTSFLSYLSYCYLAIIVYALLEALIALLEFGLI